MTQTNSIQLFSDAKIRTIWDSEQEKWYFSVVDIVAALTDSAEPKRYWSDLKRKLSSMGNETYENIVRLKMLAADGKMRNTDVAVQEQLFRIIQSIPSQKPNHLNKGWLKSPANVLTKSKLQNIQLTSKKSSEAQNRYTNGNSPVQCQNGAEKTDCLQNVCRL